MPKSWDDMEVVSHAWVGGDFTANHRAGFREIPKQLSFWISTLGTAALLDTRHGVLIQLDDM